MGGWHSQLLIPAQSDVRAGRQLPMRASTLVGHMRWASPIAVSLARVPEVRPWGALAWPSAGTQLRAVCSMVPALQLSAYRQQAPLSHQSRLQLQEWASTRRGTAPSPLG